MRCIRLFALALVLSLAACGDDDDLPVDASMDSSVDAAADAGNTVCVETFDGLCRKLSTTCVTRPAVCQPLSCSTACELALCGSRDGGVTFTCATSPCAGLTPGAFGCYGP